MHKITILNGKEFIYKSEKSKNLEGGSFTWKAPSNIALIKYWGKREVQIPENPSISFTLSNCFTETTLEFKERHSAVQSEPKVQNFDFEVFFDGEKKEDFKPKIQKFISRILEYVPFISDYGLVIKTHNSFQPYKITDKLPFSK